MKKIISILLLLSLCLSVMAPAALADGKLSVVATTFPIYDWTRQIIGDTENIELTMLLDSGVDLHNYNPTVADIRTVNHCDLFIYIGGESDAWVEDVLRMGGSDSRVVLCLMDALGENAKAEEIVEGMETEEEEEEEEANDEHIWLSLRNAQLLVSVLADALAEYCTDMGYTHVELMPITEYPYDGSWGYQVTGYFAPTSRYGDPDDFKAFVDRLHAAGIGVIVDWVPAHFPKDEFGLAEFDGTALFECKERRMAEHPDWGTLIFDYASTQVQSFLISSAFKLLDVFHVDGIRVDAVSSMLYLNYGRREGEYTPNEEGGSTNLHALRFLRKLNSLIHTDFPGVVTIAEESTAFPLVTAPAELGGVGFSLKWDMGFMHDTIDYMQQDPFFRSFHHNKLTFSMMYAFSESFVLAYSHDEVVHGKGSMINKMYGDYDQKFSSLRALYGYQFGHPGKKLTFMGNEFGQFIEWNWRQGLDWMLLGFVRHEQLRRWMRQLNLLYAANPALYAVDRSWDGFKWLNVDDAGRSSVAFLRSAPEEDSYLVCVCNFTPVSYRKFLIGLPGPGTLREVLNSDDEEYGGTGVSNPEPILSEERDFLDMHHCAELTLPPMSCVFFRYIPKT